MEKNNNLDILAHIIAYNQIRSHEEFELEKAKIESGSYKG